MLDSAPKYPCSGYQVSRSLRIVWIIVVYDTRVEIEGHALIRTSVFEN